jgi:hypothetical protein
MRSFRCITVVTEGKVPSWVDRKPWLCDEQEVWEQVCGRCCRYVGSNTAALLGAKVHILKQMSTRKFRSTISNLETMKKRSK